MDRQLNLTVTLKDGVTRPSFAGLQPLVDYLWGCKQDTPLGAPNQDCSAWLDTANPGRLYITLPPIAPASPAYNWKISIKGLGTISFRSNLFPVGSHENGVSVYYTDPQNLILEPSANFFKFPTPGLRPPLGPKEDDSSFGRVYYTLPPEFTALPGYEPKVPDIDLIRADIYSYVTPWAPQEINPICDFNFLVDIGQNTNYDMKMWFVPLLPKYPKDVQDAFLKDYAPWNTHIFYISYGQPLEAIQDLMNRTQFAGLYRGIVSKDPDEVQWLVDRDAVDVVVAGFEINLMDPNVADSIVRRMAATCKPKGIRLYVHFASQGGPNHEAHWGLFDYTTWWREMYDIGVTGAWYETYMDYEPDKDYTKDQGGDPFTIDTYGGASGDNAGKMGSMQVYMREGMMNANPNLKWISAEDWSAPPFDGYTDKNFARRRAYEMLCAPSEGRMLTNSGYVDGPVNPDGSVI